jgi:hypothetical protein
VSRLLDPTSAADTAPLRGLGAPGRLTLADVTRRGFVRLGERPGRELAFGLAGRFWTPSGGHVALDAGGFRRFQRPGPAGVFACTGCSCVRSAGSSAG